MIGITILRGQGRPVTAFARIEIRFDNNPCAQKLPDPG